MKRYLAVLLSVLMLLAAVPVVSADNNYNDDQFNWGEYACPHTNVDEFAEVPSTCLTNGCGAYTRCADCKLLLSGSRDPLPLDDHTYDNACDGDCNVCGEAREVGEHVYHSTAHAPDCLNNGSVVYTCTICGDSYSEVIPAEGHKYNDVEKAPDCENSGYTVHTCTVCGDSYVDGRVEALGHDYALTEHVYPTCVTAGKKVYVCTLCGDSYTDTLPATGSHTYDYICDERCNVCGYIRNDAHVYGFMGTVEPTCGEDGSDGYKCWECGEYKYITIPATGNHTYSGVCDDVCNVCKQTREPAASHTYILTEDVDATCTTDGKQVYTCRGCGNSYTNIITAQGHKYHIVVTAPTCEQGGYTTHTCTVCGDVCVDNRTSALGHTSVVIKGYAATCTSTGLTDGAKCSVCDKILTAQQTIPVLGHSYKSVVTTPNCENSGYTVHTCTVCGDSYVDGRVEALGHDYALTEHVAPTCVAAGKKVYVCTSCGDSYTDTLPATGLHTYDYDCDEDCNICGYIRDDAHNYISHYYEEPTCGEEGCEIYKCWGLFCGNPYVYIPIPATGNHTYSGECDTVCDVCDQIREPVLAHDYVLIEEVAVTCTTDGKQEYTCRGCGNSYTNTITAQGHKYHIVVTAPTCELGGYTTHTCTVCGDVCVDNRTAALGHAYDAVVTAPTCELGGYTTHTCTVCGDVCVDNRTAALGHAYDAVVTAPTCEQGGYTTHTCTVCGDVCVDNRTAALGHAYDAVVTAPTCIEGGYTTYTCTVCGDSYVSDYVDKGGPHAAVILKGYPATCEQEGLSSGVMCGLCGEIKIEQKVRPALGHTYDDDADIDCNTCGKERPVTRLGDINGDGKINNRDLGLLQQFVNGFDVTVDEVAADVTGDGRINNRDLGLLQQYINGFDVTLGGTK